MSNWEMIPPAHQTGWICPKCGRVLAPWMPGCNCAETRTVTYSTGTATNQGPSCRMTGEPCSKRRDKHDAE